MAERRPNILIFMTDQQQGATVRPTHLARTPRVERLAAEGVALTETWCPYPHCCPARASFHSGLYPSRHGIFNNVATDTAINTDLREGIKLFSEDLAAAGYRLKFTGKWHVSRNIMPDDRGWEDLNPNGSGRGRFSTSRDPGRWASARATGDRERGQVQRPGWGPIRVYGSVPDRGPNGWEGTGDHAIVERGLRGLRELAAAEAPWCLFIGVNGPHDPFVIPETFARLYDPDAIDLPASFADDLRDKPRIYQRQRHQYWGQLSEREVRESIAHYAGYCTMMDALFGLVVDELERTGQADNTVLLYLSDHGEYAGAHGLYCKGIPAFREAYHIPAVVRWPRGLVDPGRTVDAFVSLMDFAPTCLELAGVTPDREFDGVSLLPWLRGETPTGWRDEMHGMCNGVELYYSQRTVLTRDWKYVYNGFDFDELYDRRNDPDEIHNLAFPDPTRPAPHVTADYPAPWPPLTPLLEEVRRDLLTRLWRWARQVEDQLFNGYWTVALAPWGPGLADDGDHA